MVLQNIHILIIFLQIQICNNIYFTYALCSRSNITFLVILQEQRRPQELRPALSLAMAAGHSSEKRSGVNAAVGLGDRNAQKHYVFALGGTPAPL